MHSAKPSVLLRKQLLIDQNVQGSLLGRTALYSCACATYFIVILVFTESMSNPYEPLSEAVLRCLDEAIYWAPGLMLLTPVVAYDLLKVTNRFAGPVFRLQREMERLVNGQSVQPLSFRDGDYWIEMAETFNQVRDEIIQLREAQANASLQTSGDDEIVSQHLLFSEDPDDQETADSFLVGSDS